MENKFMKGLGRIIGFDEEDYEDEEVLEKEEGQDETEDTNELEIEPFMANMKKQSKIVNIHTASTAKVVISKPMNYDEGTAIVDNLKNRRIVIVNVTGVEQKVGHKILDFLIGAIYALEGGLQQVEKGVFILTPSNVEVTSELKTELTNKGIFSWSK
ncbi:cell division protein SepF [Clostridium tunisiense]|uniref:cell division protein SepF n=1 Tax=Clostridium tunisiense TaxID=219748 RepID=UPI0002DE0EC4|nr:cell division protein SepF [Clostridium tunisiense]